MSRAASELGRSFQCSCCWWRAFAPERWFLSSGGRRTADEGCGDSEALTPALSRKDVRGLAPAGPPVEGCDGSEELATHGRGLYRRRRGHGQRAGGRLRRRRTIARQRQTADCDLARAGGDRRTFVSRRLGRGLGGGTGGGRAGGGGVRIRRRPQLRRDLLTGGPRSRRRSASGRPQ